MATWKRVYEDANTKTYRERLRLRRDDVPLKLVIILYACCGLHKRLLFIIRRIERFVEGLVPTRAVRFGHGGFPAGLWTRR